MKSTTNSQLPLMTEEQLAICQQNLHTILNGSQPAQPGDLVHRLLERFGVFMHVPPSVLLHPRLPYFLGDEVFGEHPAMVMPLRTGAGDLVGLNTVYLGPSGFAPVVAPDQMNLLEEHPGMFFQVDAETGPVVAVAVGLGHALSARLLLSLQASLCVVRDREDLGNFDWPQGTQQLIVLCDESSQTHAQRLIDRATQAGIHTQAYTPPTPGATWLDEYLFGGAIPADEIAAAKQTFPTAQ